VETEWNGGYYGLVWEGILKKCWAKDLTFQLGVRSKFKGAVTQEGGIESIRMQHAFQNCERRFWKFCRQRSGMCLR
jgi:hypothetical protein